MNYNNLKMKAFELLKKYGRDVTVRISVKGSYDPSTDSYSTTTTDYISYGVVEEYSNAEIGGNSLIKIGDKKLMLGVNSLPELTNQMDLSVAIGFDLWKVIEVKPIQPAEVIIYYEIQIRKIQ